MKKSLTLEIAKLLPEPVVISIESELKISEDINSEVDHAAATLGFYGVLAEKAETRHQKLKIAFEMWEAAEKAAKDKELERRGQKKLTESQMRSYIKSQPKFKVFMLKLVEFEEEKRILKVIANAFSKKADLVQTKASNRRAELMKGAPTAGGRER